MTDEWPGFRAEGEKDVRVNTVSRWFLFLILAGVTSASADSYVAGTDYSPLERVQPTSTGDKAEVLEFFSYGCPHCAHFEPYLQQWKSNGDAENVKLVRVPVAWNQGFEAFARVYYSAEMLDAPDAAHTAMFNLLHEEKPPQLTLPIIADLFATHGVDRDAFLKTFESEAVTQRVQRSKQLTRLYRVTGVPELIVEGAYRVPSPPGGDFSRMLETVDFLVEKGAAGR